MTIASDILAQTPLVYWKLDDPTGPAASDSSGNAHPGVYGGSFSLGVPGPEVGTLACQLSGGNVVATTPLSGNVDQTLLLYCSLAPTMAVANSPIFGNGDPTLAVRGYVATRVSQATMQLASLYRPSGSQSLGTTNSDPRSFWHCWGISYLAATRAMTSWVDGVAGTPVTTAAVLTTTGADQLQIVSPFNMVVAHLALFNRVLTAGQMAGIGSHGSAWPYGLMIPYPSAAAPFATTVDTNALAATLASILASVRKTY